MAVACCNLGGPELESVPRLYADSDDSDNDLTSRLLKYIIYLLF